MLTSVVATIRTEQLAAHESNIGYIQDKFVLARHPSKLRMASVSYSISHIVPCKPMDSLSIGKCLSSASEPQGRHVGA